MSESGDRAVLHVPAREIPVPTSVSPEAQAVLAVGPMPSPEYPELDDAEGWRKYIAATDEMVLGMFGESGLMSAEGFEIEEISVDGVTVFVVTPPAVGADDSRVYLDIHGGAFIVGGGEVCRGTGIMTARKVGMRVWSVDYRMPPDHPYPAAVEDCLSAYRGLLDERRPEEVVVGGGSAGGNLAAALVLRARDEGLPLPAAAILLTPAMDFTHGGDTWKTNLGVDTVLTGNDPRALLLYAGGHDLHDPYLSPVFGDFSEGFPPTLLASGTRDVLLSDTVRTHRALRAAGVPAELHVLEAAPHGFFRGATPEDRALDEEVRRFVAVHCPRG
ncbi:MAG TPA: alpha/beta hydrolase [Acidimicrobiia bacterium]|nr:alpha/beta hydrolase [Acidimicrobiia bacterium]